MISDSQILLPLDGHTLPSPKSSRSRRPSDTPPDSADFARLVASFAEFGTSTVCEHREFSIAGGRSLSVPVFTNEFWTARQRAADPIHEISYRACFKPQLPRFFIDQLSRPDDFVYDPFMGRGTTPIEAALRARRPLGCDINPLSPMLVRPRLQPPALVDVVARLRRIDLGQVSSLPEELLVFYHPETLCELVSLRHYLLDRQSSGALDSVDDWIRMVAINRLTGHSPGFFSVYSLPPNQAVSVQSQKRINERRNQVPPRRFVSAIIAKKSAQLLAHGSVELRERLCRYGAGAQLLVAPAAMTPQIPSGAVHLVVTSPPFLNIVNYATDNRLRCWFVGIEAKEVAISMSGSLTKWKAEMTSVLGELQRVLAPGGHVAFEIGEVRSGTLKLEDEVVPCGVAAGLEPVLVLINQQEFTKTANCWGVDNGAKGTNTNRIVLFRKSY